jgi:hypothetical protein
LASTRHIELGERWVVHKFGNPHLKRGCILVPALPISIII